MTDERCPTCDRIGYSPLCSECNGESAHATPAAQEKAPPQEIQHSWCDGNHHSGFNIKCRCRSNQYVLKDDKRDWKDRPHPTPFDVDEDTDPAQDQDGLVGELEEIRRYIALEDVDGNNPTLLRGWAVTVERAAAEIERLQEQNIVMRQCWEKAEARAEEHNECWSKERHEADLADITRERDELLDAKGGK